MSDENFVYVVTRDGRRVSHTNHQTKEAAIQESKYWTQLIHKTLPGGAKIDPKSVIRVKRTDRPNRIK